MLLPFLFSSVVDLLMCVCLLSYGSYAAQPAQAYQQGTQVHPSALHPLIHSLNNLQCSRFLF